MVSHCSSDLVKRRISAEFECVDGHSDFSERKGHNFATLPEKFKKVKGGERTKSQFRKKFQSPVAKKPRSNHGYLGLLKLGQVPTHNMMPRV